MFKNYAYHKKQGMKKYLMYAAAAVVVVVSAVLAYNKFMPKGEETTPTV